MLNEFVDGIPGSSGVESDFRLGLGLVGFEGPNQKVQFGVVDPVKSGFDFSWIVDFSFLAADPCFCSLLFYQSERDCEALRESVFSEERDDDRRYGLRQRRSERESASGR